MPLADPNKSPTFILNFHGLGEPTRQLPLSEQDCEQLRTLHSEGMAIGTHGMCHRNWRRLTQAEVHEELDEAKDSIEELIGVPVIEAGIPYGAYDRRVLKRLHQFGYQAAHTSDGGPASLASWLRPRNTVRRSHDFDQTLRSITDVPSGVSKLWRTAKLLIKRWR